MWQNNSAFNGHYLQAKKKFWEEKYVSSELYCEKEGEGWREGDLFQSVQCHFTALRGRREITE